MVQYKRHEILPGPGIYGAAGDVFGTLDIFVDVDLANDTSNGSVPRQELSRLFFS